MRLTRTAVCYTRDTDTDAIIRVRHLNTAASRLKHPPR